MKHSLIKKGLLLTFCCLILVAGIFNCKVGGKKKKLLIGVAASSFDDKFMTYVHDGFRAGAEEEGVEIIMTDGKNDQSLQLDQIDSLITKGCDAIVIVPVDQSSIGPIIDATEKAGIPLVAVNRIPKEPYLSRLATYVGSDELYAGTIQAKKVMEMIGGKGNVVILMGILGHSGALGRTQGNHDVCAQYPGIKIVFEDTGSFQRAKGLELMENWIQTGTKIDAVLSNNDEMAIGASMALEQVGMLKDVIVAGIDATPDALQRIEEGKLNLTVFQDAYGQGRGGINAAIKAARGEELPKIIDIPFELVTPDLVDKYKAKWSM